MGLEKYLPVCFLLYGNHVLFSVLGMFLIDRFDLGAGDIVFDLKADLKKMAVSSALILGIPLVIFYHAPNLRSFAIIYFLLLLFVTKVAYLKINPLEILGLILANVVGLVLFGLVLQAKFLVYIYAPVSVTVVVFLVNRVRKEAAEEKRQAAFESRRAAEFRKILERDPQFQTLCFECLHFDPRLNDCARKAANRRTKEVRLKNNLPYCLYWAPAAAGKTAGREQ